MDTADPRLSAPLAEGEERKARITLTEHEARAFVGPRAEHFLRAWRTYMTGAVALPRFSFWAFLLGPFWFGYRKLYGLAALWFLAVSALMTYVELSAMSYTILVNVGRVGMFIIAVTAGRFANYAYLLKAERAARKARAVAPDLAGRERVLRARGGATWVGLVVTVIVGWLATAGAVALVLHYAGVAWHVV
jgi:Protein of unknown function (DUF2628)